MSRTYIPLDLRRFVSIRADGLCEYCLIHQDDTPLTHPLDDVIAVKHGGGTTEMNLALSCVECNQNKGSDIATFDPLLQYIYSELCASIFSCYIQSEFDLQLR